MRLATLSMYDRAINHITQSQSQLAQLQNNLSSGKRVSVASDDPVAAATAERALARIAQLQAQQRALNVQRDAMTTAESALGTAGDLLQRFRELAVSAGGAGASAQDRTTYANEMQSIREQLMSVANTQDANGVYLFSGWESSRTQGVATAPFALVTNAAGAPSYTYTGSQGQSDPTQTGVPYTLNGDALFMQVPRGNGTFDVSVGPSNQGQLATNMGQYSAVPAGAAMGNTYQIRFNASPIPGNTSFTYDVLNTTNPAAPTVVSSAQPYTPGQTIAFSATNGAGATEQISLMVQGQPKAGDTVALQPYTAPGGANPAQDSLFGVLDQAIAGVRGASSNAPGLAQTVAQALTRMDAGLSQVIAARSQTGIWLQRADSLTDANTQQSHQLEQDRSRAQDLDMAAAASQLSMQNTGYQVALQSYATIQKMSLFDYIR